MQLSEMRDYVRNVVDIDTTDIANTTLNTFIRDGSDLIAYSEKRWPFYEASTTFSTVADTKDYTMATVGASLTVSHDGVTISPGLREVASLRTNDHVVQYLGRDDGDVLYPLDTNSTGEPFYWTVWGNTVRLYPTPAAVYTINVRAYRNPIEFGGNTVIHRSSIADADTPDFPDPFDPVLALYAIYRAYQQQEDTGMAQQYYVAFVSELDNLADRFNDSPAPQPLALNSISVSRWRSQFLPGRLRYSWE